MDRLSTREKKIFLTVFLLLGLFVQWYGVNANSRIDLTRSIVEDHDLDINESYRNTGDRSLYRNTYYSDKAPGLSLLAVPVYGSWKAFYGLFGSTDINSYPRNELFEVNNNTTISAPESPGSFYLSSLILVILFTSTLSVSILSVLIYRISEDIVEDEHVRLALTFGFAFGTLITHYGTSFLPNASATLLAFSSFYLLYRWESHPGPKKMIFAGLLGGLGVIVNSLTAIVLAANAGYIMLKFRKLPVYYTLGGFFGGLPYMIYNTVIFGAPWELPRSHLDPAVWKNLQSNVGFRLGLAHNFFVSLRLTAMPYRGIFFWFPMLILSFFGAKSFHDEDSYSFYTALAIVTAGILVVSSWWAWWHGGWFGARHLTFIIPFLMLGVIYGARKIDRKVVYLLVVLSITVNLAGFQGNYEDMLKDLSESAQMKEGAKAKVESFKPLANPLKNHYMEGFLNRGAQSRLLNSLNANRWPPDIRSYSPETERAPLILLVVVIETIIMIIWKDEIKTAGKTAIGCWRGS